MLRYNAIRGAGIPSAEVSVRLFSGLLPLVLAASGGERPVLIAELKQVLRGYLAPLIGTPAHR